jgi:hypothetical protein
MMVHFVLLGSCERRCWLLEVKKWLRKMTSNVHCKKWLHLLYLPRFKITSVFLYGLKMGGVALVASLLCLEYGGILSQAEIFSGVQCFSLLRVSKWQFSFKTWCRGLEKLPGRGRRSAEK